MSNQPDAGEGNRQHGAGQEIVDKEVVDWQLTNHTGLRLPRLAEALTQGCMAEAFQAVCASIERRCWSTLKCLYIN